MHAKISRTKSSRVTAVIISSALISIESKSLAVIMVYMVSFIWSRSIKATLNISMPTNASKIWMDKKGICTLKRIRRKKNKF